MLPPASELKCCGAYSFGCIPSFRGDTLNSYSVLKCFAAFSGSKSTFRRNIFPPPSGLRCCTVYSSGRITIFWRKLLLPYSWFRIRFFAVYGTDRQNWVLVTLNLFVYLNYKILFGAFGWSERKGLDSAAVQIGWRKFGLVFFSLSVGLQNVNNLCLLRCGASANKYCALELFVRPQFIVNFVFCCY
jgi:hypothetical protein